MPMDDTDDSQESVGLATAARLTGLSVRQIRRWCDMGIVGDAQAGISFVDLRLLRSFATLLKLRLPARRLNRALERMSVPSNSMTTDGQSLLYRRNSRLWNAVTGQGQIEFDEATAPLKSEPPVMLHQEAEQGHLSHTAEDWYQLGVTLEHSDMKASQRAYLKAIESDPEYVAARINLGRLKQLRGQISSAVHQYREAIRLDPENSEAFYNLATVFDDLGEREVAINYYRIASRSVPEAHLHLGRLLEEQDQSMRAKWHFKAWEKSAPRAEGYEFDDLDESPSDEH